jgi:hypothetical protein
LRTTSKRTATPTTLSTQTATGSHRTCIGRPYGPSWNRGSGHRSDKATKEATSTSPAPTAKKGMGKGRSTRPPGFVGKCGRRGGDYCHGYER